MRLFKNRTYFIEDRIVKIPVYPRTYAKCLLMGNERWFSLLNLAKGSELIKRNDEFYLHVVLEKNVENSGSFVVGIDTNLSNLTLVCLNDKTVIAKHVIYLKKIHGKRLYLRNVRAFTQSRYNIGKNKKRNVMRNEIEKISSEILKFVRNYDCIVAIEDVKYVRKKLVKVARSKRQKYLFSSFFYNRLLQRIKEKLEWNGIKVVEVNPKGTSLVCSKCGEMGIRKGKTFVCSKCNLVIDADLNAAVNMALRSTLLKR